MERKKKEEKLPEEEVVLKKEEVKLPEEEVGEEKKEVPTPAPVDPRIHWQKVGGGSLRLNIGGVNRILKPDEKFWALEREIPKAFRDTVVAIDGTFVPRSDEAVSPLPTPPVKNVYTIVPRGKSKSLFDVKDKFGKAMNEAPLPKAIAEQLVRDLLK